MNCPDVLDGSPLCARMCPIRQETESLSPWSPGLLLRELPETAYETEKRAVSPGWIRRKSPPTKLPPQHVKATGWLKTYSSNADGFWDLGLPILSASSTRKS